jgi:RecA-family ATPase
MNIRRLNIRSALANAPPALDFVLPGLLSGTAGTIVGSGGVGKTTLLLQLSMALSSNMPVGGHILSMARQPSRVVFVAAEESADIMRIRLHAINASMKQQQASLLSFETEEDTVTLMDNNLCLLPAAGHSVSLLKNGEPTPFYDELCRLCHGARLVVIDPLRRLHDGDENNSASMTQLVQLLESLAKRTGAAVIAAHHVNKGAVFAGMTDLAGASRGSSALTDAVRWQVNLSAMSEPEAKAFGLTAERRSYLRLDIAKANYMSPQPTIWMKRLEGGALTHVDLSAKSSSKTRTSAKSNSRAHGNGEVTYV